MIVLIMVMLNKDTYSKSLNYFMLWEKKEKYIYFEISVIKYARNCMNMKQNMIKF